MQTATYAVRGMHCASCSAVIERSLKKLSGVERAEVNYGTEKAKISYDPSLVSPEALSREIEPLGYSLSAADMEC
jgi:P-type Cu+ transporter